MARTKQTTRRSTGGQAPRKELTSKSCQKRPLEIEDNYDDGNERKKIKLDLHDGDDSSDYSDAIGAACETSSSDSSDYADDVDNSQMENVQASVKATLESKKFSDFAMLKFIKNLNAMSSATKAKINELQYREKARSAFLAEFQRKIRKPKFDAAFFTKELFEFAKSIIQAFRFRSVEDQSDWDYGTFRWTDYSVDIALKSRKNFVHPKYEEAMHGLLGRHVHDIQPISHLITQYTNNQFVWYRVELAMDDPESDDKEPWQNKAQGGILKEVKYDANDYFRDSKFYKAKKPSTGARASFAKMRKDLNIKRSLTDEQLAQFIGCIAVYVFSLDESDFDDAAEEWIIEQHA